MNWNLTGQDWAVRLLAEHVASGAERHAYLFTGPPGVGRRTLALRFAQALNCLEPPQPGQPCLRCRTCEQIERMQHPDLFVVQAEQEGKILKVEQIRSLQHSLSLSAYESRYRIALLLRFQEANASAANALLKTLEEAPARVILLLTADVPEGLLPTIVSRCEVLRLRPMPVAELASTLQRAEALPGDQARSLAHLTGGRLGTARRLLADPAALVQRRAWIDDALRLVGEPRRERFAYAEKLSKDRDRLRQALLAWQSLWRDVLLCATGATIPLVNLEHEKDIRDLAGWVDLDGACRQLDALEAGLRREESNVNARLLAEALLLDWPRIRK